MAISYAVEIQTNTVFTNATYGLGYGVFRFITDRPGYQLTPPLPTYGPDEIDIDGTAIGGQDVIVAFYEGFLLKDAFTSNPNRSIDITSCGNYSTDSKFSFKIRNDLKFWDYCQTNNIVLAGQRVIMWVIIDNVFYQCARGRIVNNPYTETDFGFDIDDDATLIHKNIPPQLSVLPAPAGTALTLPTIQQGDPIPVVFGNVPYSKILKNNTDNYVLPLNAPYLPAAATAYNIVSVTDYRLVLYTSITDFAHDDPRLVGLYLYVIAGSTADRVYKIVNSTASTGNLVTIYLDSPIVISTGGDGSTDVLLSDTHFNTDSNHYKLTGSGPYVSTAATWWFQISDYTQKSYVSTNPVTVSDVLEFDSNTKKYNSVANLLDLASTPAPTIKLTANTATKDGKVTQYERINIPLIDYGSGYGKAPDPFVISDYFDLPSDILLVTDKSRATMQLGFTPAVMNNDFCIFADYHPQPTLPAYNNQVLSKAYSAIYFCVDMFLRGTGTDHLSTALQCEVTDVNNAILPGALGTSPDVAYKIDIPPAGKNVNFVPNSLISDSAVDPTTLFGSQSKTIGNTYRLILKMADTSLSIFASAQIKNIRFKLYLTTNDTTTIEVKEICLVGELSIDTITADIFARVQGETVSNDGITPTDNVYAAFRHILEDYDGIPAKLIDYGSLASDRTTNWAVSRTLTEKKNSVDYLNELCAQSFVGMFSGRTGQRVLRALSFSGILTPTTGNGKTATHDASLIVRNSISSYVKTSLDNVYNYFRLQYGYDAGSNDFLRGFNIANVDQAAFPDSATTDAYGNPLWWSFVSGLPTSTTNPTVGYYDSQILWEACHVSYLLNSVVHQAQSDISQLSWFSDSLIWALNDTSSTGTSGSAYQYLNLLLQWCTLQKDIVSYSIPINANTCETELLDIINFNDIIYTNGNNIPGWVIGLETDASKDQLNLQVILQPLSLAVEEGYKIIETGSAAKTITETGSAPNIITEGAPGIEGDPLPGGANIYADVIRHEDTTADLPTTTRNGQVTFETDNNKRQLRKTIAGASNYWTPDDTFTAAIPSYTNVKNSSFHTVKDALDYIVANMIPTQILRLDSTPAKITGTAILYWLTGYPGIIHCLFDDGTTNGTDYIIFDGTATI